jgi:H+/Cl- antiporter ClcA
MKTHHITDTITDALPTVVDALTEVGTAIGAGAEVVGGAVSGAVSDGVSSGRRYANSITTPSWMPGPTAHSNRRWWFAAGALALLAVVGAVWYTRRSDNDAAKADGVADLDQRRSVA